MIMSNILHGAFCDKYIKIKIKKLPGLNLWQKAQNKKFSNHLAWPYLSKRCGKHEKKLTLPVLYRDKIKKKIYRSLFYSQWEGPTTYWSGWPTIAWTNCVSILLFNWVLDEINLDDLKWREKVCCNPIIVASWLV